VNIANLVDVEARDLVVKSDVQVIEQIDDFERTTFGRECREPDDIREVDGRRIIQMWCHLATGLQLVGNESEKKTEN